MPAEYNEPGPGEWEWVTPTHRHRSRKDRRHWCRGKPGVEHGYTHVEYREYDFGFPISLHVDQCVKCGRKMLYSGSECRAQECQ